MSNIECTLWFIPNYFSFSVGVLSIVCIRTEILIVYVLMQNKLSTYLLSIIIGSEYIYVFSSTQFDVS